MRALLAHDALDEVAEECASASQVLAALDLLAEPMRLELGDDLVEVDAGHVHLVERLDGGEARRAPRLGTSPRGLRPGLAGFLWPGRSSAPARRGEMLLELHQGEAGSRRVAAFVAARRRLPAPGLLAAVAGENAVAERHGVLDGERIQAGRGFPRDDVVVGGLAADDAAKRDTAAMAPCSADEAVGKRQAERERDLERARHGEPLIVDAAASSSAMAPRASSSAMSS